MICDWGRSDGDEIHPNHQSLITNPQLLPKQPRNLAFFGVATFGFFTVDQGVVGEDFEAPAGGWNEFEVLNRWGVAVQQIGCRTDSPRGVVSLYAVFDAHFVLLHGWPPSGSAQSVRCVDATNKDEQNREAGLV